MVGNQQSKFAKKMVSNCFLLFLTLFLQQAQAQRGWELGAWAGVSHYFGDLNTSFNISHPGAAGGIIGRFNFNDRLCLKMGINYGRLQADDANAQNAFERQRNLSFRSAITDGVMQFEFNFLPFIHGSRTQNFTPYVFGGINVFHFNPKAFYDGKWVALRGLGTEGQFKGEEYYSVQGGLAYGLGLKWSLSEVWSINLELSSRRLFTDYLDDVSTAYPNMRDLFNARGATAVALSDRSLPNAEGIKLGQAGRQRGNSRTSDMYTFLGIGVLYYFGDLKCPPISFRSR
jgi:hypothetical protein